MKNLFWKKKEPSETKLPVQNQPDKKVAKNDPKEEDKQLKGFTTKVVVGNGIQYEIVGDVGTGSFGVVVGAINQTTKEKVALKRVLQDQRYKNRELQIMQMLKHPNIVALRDSFFQQEASKRENEIYLTLVMEYVPNTVYQVTKSKSQKGELLDMIVCKLYIYQLFKALGFMHSLGVCHRDIKPQNLLVNEKTGVLKLCDFGSSKIFVRNEPNVAYICSRYYRAPELIFGSTTYGTAIDVWSTGCVLGELILGKVLFAGKNSVEQLVEIIKILGTPTAEEVKKMNPNYTEQSFPSIKTKDWGSVYGQVRNNVDISELVDLTGKILRYIPESRFNAYQAMAHPFFKELKSTSVTLPDGTPLPTGLFSFAPEELKAAGDVASQLQQK